ncbi:hypothetical protein WHR41_02369 [Cladosporium halotolerans]|uniref:Transcription factor Iwr1 domain-containing protein n=1 Tax=Cladosporium halotolerans TaxID=1052096 RepID=A0AB34KYD5_9PEZI
MEGPGIVRLQRRRDELPPDQLYVERKRKHRGSFDEGSRGYYIRQKRQDDKPEAAFDKAEQTAQPVQTEERRTFHLRQPTPSVPATPNSKSRKRKQNEDSLATVVEKKQRKFDNDAVTTSTHQYDHDLQEPPSPPRTKRPGRGSALRPRATQPKPEQQKQNESVIARQQREVQALAQEMHQFALDELAKTPKPEVKAKPKLPPSRSRALHQESIAAPQGNLTDDPMDSDSEYVYDTYILAPAPTDPTEATTNALTIPSNVGYLIISENDEDLWETYMHDLEASDSEPTDEDDENAEDYYGADYPSDELASDDEHDRGAYGYRARRGSNDEQYGPDDDENDSDNDPTWSDEEDFRMMNPFARKSRVPAQFAKYLNRDRTGEQEDRA